MDATAALWPELTDALITDAERPALIDAQGVVLSRGALLAQIETWRETVQAADLTPAHRVATLLPNGFEAAILLLALIPAVNVLPLNPNANPDQLADTLRDGDVDLVLVSPDLEPEGTALRQSIGKAIPVISLTEDLSGSVKTPKDATRSPGLVLQTSGSTGTPKRVPLRPDQLVISARNIAGHLDLSPEDRALHALPMFHVGAVVDLLLAPLLSGGSAAFARDLNAGSLVDVLSTQAPTWLQLVPTALGHLLEAPDLPPDTGLRFVRMVSADLSEDLRERAEHRLGVPVIQMYGMTETAGQITSNPLPPAQRKPLSVGVPAGADIAIIDSEGALVDHGREGEVCVRGETVMTGYEGDAQTPRHGDWLRSGDLGRLDEDGYLFLTGRLKEIINRGGEKISPVTVERAAKALSDVTEAVAFALPHPTLGEQVGLAVVAQGTVKEDTLLAALGHSLAEYERPRRITFLDALPKLASGKVDRLRVAALAQGGRGAIEPLSPLAKTVAARWTEVLNVAPPHDNSDFFDDGGDSLSATDFLMALEKDLGRAMPPNLLFEAPRFAQLVAALEADTPAPEETPLVKFLRERTAGWRGQRVGPNKVIVARNTVASGTKLFFGGHGNLGANVVAATVARDHPVYMLRSTRGYARNYRAEIPKLAALYVEEIDAILAPGEPVLLGGFCGGANLMEAIAPGLIARGHPVNLLLAIDKRFETPTPYPVLYIWTDWVNESNAARYARPKRGFRALHPAGAHWVRLPGQHDRALTKKKLARLTPKIAPYLGGEPLPAFPDVEPLDFDERRARWSAKLNARLPRILPLREAKTVPVRITNTSGIDWPPSRVSGLHLVAGIYARDGECVSLKDIRAPLPTGLKAGETTEISLPILWPQTPPRRPRVARLVVTMADEGIGTFADLGQGQVSRWCVVFSRPWHKARSTNDDPVGAQS